MYKHKDFKPVRNQTKPELELQEDVGLHFLLNKFTNSWERVIRV